MLDRYVIERRLGAGAMGVVYVARDPELDRQVAIKLIKAEVADEALRVRLYREAQALARVAHPNVVAIHDVGTHDGQVFIAMEMVRGTTLRAWFAEKRAWQDTLAMLVAAGRGLAAAHDAGLVHRDFKPDNVLVGEDGRARVTDFGLARAADGDSGDPSASISMPGMTSSPSLGSPLTDSLTRTGSVLGTPVYAAPEQLAGERAGPEADQFGFCVTAYEAFYGRRPFVAGSLEELRRKVTAGEIQPPPPGRAIPGRIHRALLRGMAVDPDARFPSMDALLAALRPPARRWPWVAAAAAAIAIPTAIVLALPGGAPARCRSADDRLAGVWDPARRGQVVAAFAAHAGFAELGTKLAGHLDAYATTWRAGWTAACTAPEQTTTMFDRRIACLEQRRGELAAAAVAASAVDREKAGTAMELLGVLEPVERCADTAALANVPVPSAEQRAAVETIQNAIVSAKVAINQYDFATAREQITRAVAQARELGYQPALGEALGVMASAERKADRLTEAESAAKEWVATALALNEPSQIAMAFTELARVRMAQGQLERSEESLGHVAGLPIARTDWWVQYELAVGWGELRGRQMRNEDAIRHYSEALALLEANAPELTLDASYVLLIRTTFHQRLGRLSEVRADLERALALATAAQGEASPAVATIQSKLAEAMWLDGRYPEAWTLGRRAHATLVATAGPDHTTVAVLEDSLARFAYELGDYAASEAYHQHILAVHRAVDPSSLGTILPRAELGILAIQRGKAAEAADSLRALLAEVEANRDLGKDSLFAAVVGAYLAFAETELGRPADALPRLVHGEAIVAAQLGREHAAVGIVQLLRGLALLRQGRAREALAVLQAAEPLVAPGESPTQHALLLAVLAEARWATGDRPGAKTTMTAAIARLDQVSTGASPWLRARIARWQAAHP
jgi:tetratricopeptide (TPR) repeat protein